MNIKNREKLLMIGAGLVIGLLVGDRMIVSPLTAAWKDRSDRIAKTRTMLSNGDMLLQREKSIRAHWRDMQANALPLNRSEAEIKTAEAMAHWVQASRIKLTGTKRLWREAREDDDYTTLEYTADAEGDIQSVARFIYELERDPLALKVEELNITARDAGGQQLALQVRFTGLQLALAQK